MKIHFSPTNPFPMLSEAERNYSAEKEHARQVDDWLGYNIDEIEKQIARRLAAGSNTEPESRQQLWSHLDAQAFLTPYTELREIVERLQPQAGTTFVDLGAGYGRLAHVLALYFPGVIFVGYELAAERCREAERVLDCRGHQHANQKHKMYVQDLSLTEFQPEAAAFYFLYDYGEVTAIRKTLEDLRLIAQAQSIVVVARGRASRNLIDREQPWLSAVVKPEHYDRYSIYRSS